MGFAQILTAVETFFSSLQAFQALMACRVTRICSGPHGCSGVRALKLTQGIQAHTRHLKLGLLALSVSSLSSIVVSCFVYLARKRFLFWSTCSLLVWSLIASFS